MPAFANIVLNDGAGTPVAHTFAPNTLVGTLSTFADRSGGIAVGYPVISISSVSPSKTSRLYKVRAKIVMPVLEVVNSSTYSGITPAPTKAYDMTADMTFFIPERSTLQQRKDILAFAKNFLSNAVATALVETQETVY
jgi:hypothetical protein